MSDAPEKLLTVNPLEDSDKLKALANDIRVAMLDLLRDQPLNVNQIAEKLNLPQSTAVTHLAILEKAGLIITDITKAKKGNQKLCRPSFQEILIQFPERQSKAEEYVQVEMPIGIFNDFHVTAPCGLCSTESVIGYLDTMDSFLHPDRMKAGLLWCGSGWFEYKFPNNSIYDARPLKRLEFSMELSSETPGTNSNWPSDITMWVNNIETGTWVSPGDFGDKRGKFTPDWWKLEGSQYGLLKTFGITEEGTFVDGVKISEVTLADLHIADHHSIKMKIGVKEDAQHLGGMNIFGRGFGNYGQGIILRLYY